LPTDRNAGRQNRSGGKLQTSTLHDDPPPKERIIAATAATGKWR